MQLRITKVYPFSSTEGQVPGPLRLLAEGLMSSNPYVGVSYQAREYLEQVVFVSTSASMAHRLLLDGSATFQDACTEGGAVAYIGAVFPEVGQVFEGVASSAIHLLQHVLTPSLRNSRFINPEDVQFRWTRDCPKCGANKGNACRSPACVQLKTPNTEGVTVAATSPKPQVSTVEIRAILQRVLNGTGLFEMTRMKDPALFDDKLCDDIKSMIQRLS